MLFPIGVAISIASVIWSVNHLHQSWAIYADLIAAAVVGGGTFAVGLVIMPWDAFGELMRGIKYLFVPRPNLSAQLVKEGIELVRSTVENTRFEGAKSAGLGSEILASGQELIQLGLETKKVEAILNERIHHSSERFHRVALAFKNLSKYPPAFGLIGTVLSLVSVMRAVSEGAGSSDTGMRMAVALIATFYGLIVANLIVNPAAENISKVVAQERREAELALQAVLLACDRTSLLEAQEMLNAFVKSSERVNVIGGSMDEAKEAA